MEFSEILLQKGFVSHFPFIGFYTKENIHVKMFYQVNFRKDKIEDSFNCHFGIKVTKFDLPNMIEKIFKEENNALKYIFEN